MKRTVMKILIPVVLLALSLIAIFTPRGPQTVSAYVERVHDGDTLTVRYLSNSSLPEDIRLYSIDAPELPTGEGYDARDYLRSLALGKYVTITHYGRLTYGRLLAYVKVDNIDLSCAMCHMGYARALFLHPEEERRRTSINSCTD